MQVEAVKGSEMIRFAVVDQVLAETAYSNADFDDHLAEGNVLVQRISAWQSTEVAQKLIWKT